MFIEINNFFYLLMTTMFWPVQTIALKLLQSCVEDGSPLVRRELVVALQWVLLTFLPNFINLLKALQVDTPTIALASSVIWKPYFILFFGSYGQMSIVANPRCVKNRDPDPG
jgi:hypothetical protein